jgi:tetratricopeptide (TPR) repeat protein
VRRLRRPHSQAWLAGRVGCDPTLVTKVERADAWPSESFSRRLDEVLDTGGTFSALWKLLERERDQQARREAEHRGAGREVASLRVLGDTEREADEEPVIVLALDGRYDLMRRRDFMRAAGAAAVAPLAETLLGPPLVITAHEASAAAAEAHQLTAVAEPLALTPAELAWLDQQVAELDALWHAVPLATLFHRARALRREIARFLAGGSEAPHLALLAGTVSLHLAEALLDAGHYDAAWEHTEAGIAHARAAGHAELLCALAAERSRIRGWQGRHDEALRIAQDGEAFVRDGSAAAVKLYEKLAQAAALVGDLRETLRGLRAGEHARETVPASTTPGYLWPTSEAFWAMGSGGTLARIGELGAAEQHAARAVELYQARGGSRPSLNLTFAWLALARAQQDPDAAASIGGQAIEAYLAQPRRSQTIVSYAGEVLAKLVPYPEVPEVRDFQERYRALVRDGVPGAATGGPCG